MDVYVASTTSSSAVASSAPGQPVKPQQPKTQKQKTAKSKNEELLRLQARFLELKAQADAHKKEMSSLKTDKVSQNGQAPRNDKTVADVTSTSTGAVVFSNVDRRPSKIHASGFEPEDKDEVLSHFASLGNVINFLWDGQTPSITVEYSTRRHAEKAMNEGRNFGDRLLTLMWVNESRSQALPPVPSTQQYQDLQYKPEEDEPDEDEDLALFEEPKATALRPPVLSSSNESKNPPAASKRRVSEDSKKEDDILDPDAIIFDEVVELGDEGDEDEDKEGARAWRR